MTSLGQKLRSERLEKGWSVELVSFRSKIQTHVIEQLEEDDYAAFSSSSYVRSFLRKYGELLELDLEEEIRRVEVSDHSLLSDPTARENVRENLEMARFSVKNERFRKAERTKGSPVFLVGSVFFLMSGLALFYYLGSQASDPKPGSQSLFDQFESRLDSFSRDREVRERLLSEKQPVSPLATPADSTEPLANTREVTLIKAIPVQIDEDGITKPDLRSFSPLSDLEEGDSPGGEPLVRTRSPDPIGIEGR